jgi:hypothetical protein
MFSFDLLLLSPAPVDLATSMMAPSRDVLTQASQFCKHPRHSFSSNSALRKTDERALFDRNPLCA